MQNFGQDNEDRDGTGLISRADVEALRASPVLSHVSTPNLERLIEAAETRTYPQGTTLFREGDLASRLFLLKSGVVQIIRPDADSSQLRAQVHLHAGEVLCDVGIFTGVKHRSTAIAAERVEALTISWQEVKNVFRQNPHLAHQFCAALAHALTAARTLLESTKGSNMTLKGSLNGVDLLGLVHTLATCEDLAGHIMIHDDRLDTIGSITIREGGIVGAAKGQLAGDAAFFDLVMDVPEGAGFCFREAGRVTKAGSDRDDAIKMPSAHLVLEATRQRDELQRFRAMFEHDEARVVPGSGQLVWTGPSLGLAMKMWRDLQCGKTVKALVAGAPIAQELRTYTLLNELIESGQATLSVPDGASPAE